MKKILSVIILVIGILFLAEASVGATDVKLENTDPYFSAKDAPWVESGEILGPIKNEGYAYYISKKEKDVINVTLQEKDEISEKTFLTVLNILDSCNRDSENDEITTEISSYIKKGLEKMDAPFDYGHIEFKGFKIEANNLKDEEAEQNIPDDWEYLYIRVELTEMRSDKKEWWFKGGGGAITSDGSETTENENNASSTDNNLENSIINSIFNNIIADETISNNNIPQTGNGYEIDIVSYALLTIIGLALISSFIIIRKSKIK